MPSDPADPPRTEPRTPDSGAGRRPDPDADSRVEVLGDLVPERLRDAPLWERVLCLAGGIFFLLLGVVGWLLPVVTGIPFYVIGLFLLAGVAPPARHFVNWLDRKLPMGVRRLLRKVRRDRSPPTPRR